MRFLMTPDSNNDEDQDIRELFGAQSQQSKHSLFEGGSRQKDSMIGNSMMSEEKELFFEEVYDDSQAFNLPGLNIEMLHFISDSTLMAITTSQEIRVLNSSSFNPETYDADRIKQQTKNSLRSAPL